MSKVCRIGIPKRAIHLTSKEIKSYLMSYKEYMKDVSELVNNKHSDYFTKAVRLDDEVSDDLNRLSDIAGLPLTVVTTILISIQLDSAENAERERQELLKRLKELDHKIKED